MATEPAMADISVDEFLRNYDSSGLSAVTDARAAAAAIAAPTGSTVAAQLVANGVLTAYQARALLQNCLTDLRMGNYDILDKLGVGGMGAVYKAMHRRMKRVVALKVLSKSVASSPMFAQRFQREVEVIAKLHHPNVVMAFDADEAEEGPFLIMEFVDGRDLADEVETRGPLSVADGVICILQAGRGLEYAHGLGIVHRDIKPSNLLRDVSGEVKVADLGLARLSSEQPANFSLTQAGSVLGTIDYMAPEQALDSASVDNRADIYSLGCTLFFLLAGRPPYQSGSIMGMLLKHREGAIPSLCEARQDAPIELDAIFRRMVAKDPAERFAKMTEVLTALETLTKTAVLSDRRPERKVALAAGGATDCTVAYESPPAADTGYETNSLDATKVISATPTSVQGRVVVLVEPSRTQAGIIRRYLEQLGITTLHNAKSGNEALQLAKRENADVIVSSMHLADMTGVQLAVLLLADPTCDRVSFILATSESDTDAAATIAENSRVVLMPKPFDLQRLNQAIASIVN